MLHLVCYPNNEHVETKKYLSLPTPEIRGLNPDIGKILSTNCTIEKTKIQKKRPGMVHL